MITDYEAAVFSKIAYRNEDDEVVIELLGSLDSSVGWIRSERLYDDVTGLGLSIFSCSTGENAVIAFRGTKVPKNIISDIQILLGWPVSIEAQAQKIYLEKQAEHSNITLTGHSLGGALATMLSLEYGLNAIVFDSPGCHRITKEKPSFSRHKELIRNIVGRPNLINTCDKHVGTLLLADVLPETPIESIGSYADNEASIHTTLELHKMEYILNHLRSLPSSQSLPYVIGWCNWLSMIYTPHKIPAAILSYHRIQTDLPDIIDNPETAEGWMPEFSVCRFEAPRITSGAMYYTSSGIAEETKSNVASASTEQLFSSQLAYPRATPKRFNHEHWVVSAVNSYGTRYPDGRISGAHAFLVVEGREGDQFFIGKYEIFARFPRPSLDNPNPSGYISKINVIESWLPTHDSLEFIENIQRYNNQRCSFEVLRTDVETMIASIKKDEKNTQEANLGRCEPIPYQFLGMTGLGMLFTPERDGGLNCASWCFEKLTISKAPFSKKQSKKSSDPNVVAGGNSSLVTCSPPDADANSGYTFSFCRTS